MQIKSLKTQNRRSIFQRFSVFLAFLSEKKVRDTMIKLKGDGVGLRETRRDYG